MDFGLTGQQEAVRKAAREFAETELAPRARDNDRAARCDPGLIRRMGAAGWLGVPLLEGAVRAANAAIQVHGGNGYFDEYPVERYLRNARVATLYEGTSQIQKLIIGKRLTGIDAISR